MAEVEGSDGNQYNIPDFALEDTQEKILGIMKKTYKLSDAEIKNAQKALANDDKNSKSQIDALKKLGVDIKDAVDGKGTFFGGLKDSTLGAVGVLTSLTKGVGVAVGVIGTLGAAATAAALSLTKGFGDEIAGLAASGAAFGDLGESLNTTIPQLRTMGLSMGEAVNAVENFRVSMTVLGAKGTTDVIKSFQDITNMGSDYGRSISENIDFLAEEIQTRQMLGFFQRRSAKEEAESAKELMDSQIAASKLLGKSVDDIAAGVKQLFGRDDFKASFARMGEGAAETLRKTFQTFEGAEIGDGMMEGLAKAFTDPIMTQSEEARKSLSALRLIDPKAANEVQKNIEGFRRATEAGDDVAAAAFAKEAERLTLETLSLKSLEGLSDKERKQRLRQLELQGRSNDALAGTLANQNAIKEAFANYGKEQDITLNEAARTSTMFDNIITLLSNSFGALYTSVQAGIAPALEAFTKAFGETTDENSAIYKFQARLSEISEKISASFNRIFGDSEKLGGEGGAIPLVNGLLDTLASVIESTADNILGFVDSLMANDGTSFMDKISKFVGDMIGDLLGIIGEQIRKIDFMDLLFGDSKDEVVEDTAKSVEHQRRQVARMGGDEDAQAKQMEMLLNSTVGDIQEFAKDKELDPSQTLQMIADAGIQVQELSGAKLMEMFPNPDDLKTAITDVYGSDMTEASAAWDAASKKIIANSENIADGDVVGFFKSLGESDEETSARLIAQREQANAWASAGDLEPPKPTVDDLQEVVVTATKKEEKLGTPPAQASSTSVIKDPETAEPTTPAPTSADGTPTQEVKPVATKGEDEKGFKSMEELMFMQYQVLQQISIKTGKVNGSIGNLIKQI